MPCRRVKPQGIDVYSTESISVMSHSWVTIEQHFQIQSLHVLEISLLYPFSSSQLISWRSLKGLTSSFYAVPETAENTPQHTPELILTYSESCIHCSYMPCFPQLWFNKICGNDWRSGAISYKSVLSHANVKANIQNHSFVHICFLLWGGGGGLATLYFGR